MVEPGGDLDLGEEPLDAQDRAEFGPEDLERHLAVVLEVGGEVDRGHAALAEHALDAVAVGQGGRQAGGNGVHRRDQGIARTLRCLKSASISSISRGALLIHSSPRSVITYMSSIRTPLF